MDFSRHASQLLSSFAPGSSRYVLIGQEVQASVPTAALKKPGAQAVQMVQGGLTHSNPFPHGSQRWMAALKGSSAAGATEYPAGQSTNLKIASSLIQFEPATTTSSVSSP